MRSFSLFSFTLIPRISHGLTRRRLKLASCTRRIWPLVNFGNRLRHSVTSVANVQSYIRAEQKLKYCRWLHQPSQMQSASAQPSNAHLSNTDCQPSSEWMEEATLYVHWPYCQRRCTYCNFNKYIDDNVDHDKMQQCLVREACTLIDISGIKRIKSVFFGGGTPSLAKPQTLQAVLDAVSGLVDLPRDAEVTMEGNPTSVGLNKLQEFKQAGINRVSLGVQALNDNDLRLLGRDHTAAESIRCVEEARRLFPGHVSLDLIFGRPGQTLSSWQQELQQVLAICDNHVSLYQLTLERGTALFKMHESGMVCLPADDDVADMYSLAVGMMAEKGLSRYEVSNFARHGSESRHNQAYWEGGQYIGVGPGAHGRFIPIKCTNISSRTNFCTCSTDKSHACTEGIAGVTQGRVQRFREARIQTLEPRPWMYEVLKYGHGTRKRVQQSQLDVLQELLMCALRTNRGVTGKRWAELAGGRSLGDVFGNDKIRGLSDAGLMIYDSAGLRATPKGVAVLDSIMPHLLLILQDWYRDFTDVD